MKKLLVLICVVGMALIFVAAALPVILKSSVKKNKSTGCGYRIIEFGVGVNCNGDTIRLKKSKGFQELELRKKNALDQPGVSS